jgi:hypothetical protein
MITCDICGREFMWVVAAMEGSCKATADLILIETTSDSTVRHIHCELHECPHNKDQ